MNWEARVGQVIAGVLMFAMMVVLAYFFAQAFLQESEMRVERLERHFRIAMRHDGPSAPTGVRPNYGEPSTPKVRHFQDASERGGSQ